MALEFINNFLMLLQLDSISRGVHIRNPFLRSSLFIARRCNTCYGCWRLLKQNELYDRSSTTNLHFPGKENAALKILYKREMYRTSFKFKSYLMSLKSFVSLTCTAFGKIKVKPNF